MDTVDTVQLDEFFIGGADRCERLISALQFCCENGLSNESALTADDLGSCLEKGLLYQRMIDLSTLCLPDQIPIVFSKFSEFGERLDLLSSSIEIQRKSAAQSAAALKEALLAIDTAASSLSQTVYAIIDFTTSGEECSGERSVDDLLIVLFDGSIRNNDDDENNDNDDNTDDKENVPKSDNKENRREGYPCLSSILRIDEDVSYSKFNKNDNENGNENENENPQNEKENSSIHHVNTVINTILDRCSSVSYRGSVTIRMAFLLPLNTPWGNEAEGFYLSIQNLRKLEMGRTIQSLRSTAIDIKQEINQEKKRLSCVLICNNDDSSELVTDMSVAENVLLGNSKMEQYNDDDMVQGDDNDDSDYIVVGYNDNNEGKNKKNNDDENDENEEIPEFDPRSLLSEPRISAPPIKLYLHSPTAITSLREADILAAKAAENAKYAKKEMKSVTVISNGDSGLKEPVIMLPLSDMSKDMNDVINISFDMGSIDEKDKKEEIGEIGRIKELARVEDIKEVEEVPETSSSPSSPPLSNPPRQSTPSSSSHILPPSSHLSPTTHTVHPNPTSSLSPSTPSSSSSPKPLLADPVPVAAMSVNNSVDVIETSDPENNEKHRRVKVDPLRSSLVNELLGFMGSQSVEENSEVSSAIYGLKAYTALRDNIFSHRDWDVESSGTEGPESPNGSVYVPSSTYDGNESVDVRDISNTTPTPTAAATAPTAIDTAVAAATAVASGNDISTTSTAQLPLSPSPAKSEVKDMLVTWKEEMMRMKNQVEDEKGGGMTKEIRVEEDEEEEGDEDDDDKNDDVRDEWMERHEKEKGDDVRDKWFEKDENEGRRKDRNEQIKNDTNDTNNDSDERAEKEKKEGKELKDMYLSETSIIDEFNPMYTHKNSENTENKENNEKNVENHAKNNVDNSSENFVENYENYPDMNIIPQQIENKKMNLLIEVENNNFTTPKNTVEKPGKKHSQTPKIVKSSESVKCGSANNDDNSPPSYTENDLEGYHGSRFQENMSEDKYDSYVNYEESISGKSDSPYRNNEKKKTGKETIQKSVEHDTVLQKIESKYHEIDKELASVPEKENKREEDKQNKKETSPPNMISPATPSRDFSGSYNKAQKLLALLEKTENDIDAVLSPSRARTPIAPRTPHTPSTPSTQVQVSSFPGTQISDFPHIQVDDFPQTKVDDFPHTGVDDFPHAEVSDLDRLNSSMRNLYGSLGIEGDMGIEGIEGGKSPVGMEGEGMDGDRSMEVGRSVEMEREEEKEVEVERVERREMRCGILEVESWGIIDNNHPSTNVSEIFPDENEVQDEEDALYARNIIMREKMERENEREKERERGLEREREIEWRRKVEWEAEMEKEREIVRAIEKEREMEREMENERKRDIEWEREKEREGEMKRQKEEEREREMERGIEMRRNIERDVQLATESKREEETKNRSEEKYESKSEEKNEQNRYESREEKNEEKSERKHEKEIFSDELLSDLKESRLLIEEKRRIGQVELFRRRKVQGLEILSRLLLDTTVPPSSSSIPSFSVATSSHAPSSSSYIPSPSSSTSLPSSSYAPSSARANGSAAGTSSATVSPRYPSSSSSTPRMQDDINQITHRSMPREHRNDYENNFTNDKNINNENLESESKNNENGSKYDDKNERNDRNGEVSSNASITSRISRPRVPPQALTDAQKDSIVRQIRSASAGRQRTEATVLALKKEKELLVNRANALISEAENKFETDKLTPNRRILDPALESQGQTDRHQQAGRQGQGQTDRQGQNDRQGQGYGQIDRQGERRVSQSPSPLKQTVTNTSPRDGNREDFRGNREGREDGSGVRSMSAGEKRVRNNHQNERNRGRELRKEVEVEVVTVKKFPPADINQINPPTSDMVQGNNDDEMKRMAKFDRMKEKKRLEAEARATEKEREKERAKSNRRGTLTVVPTPILPAPPLLPADQDRSNASRRRTLEPTGSVISPRNNSTNNTNNGKNNNTNNTNNGANNSASNNANNSTNIQNVQLSARSKSPGRTRSDISAKEKDEVITKNDESSTINEESVGGYYSVHMLQKKEKDKNSVIKKVTQGNGNESERGSERGNSAHRGQRVDEEEGEGGVEGEDEMTVRSRFSSFSARTTHTTHTTNTTNTSHTNKTANNNPDTQKRSSSVGKSTPGRIIRPQKTLSNLQQVKNAINHVCLAGGNNETQRMEAVSTMESCTVLTDNQESCPISQFLVLFYHSKSLSFRGIYAVHPFNGSINRIFGRGPRVLLTSYIEEHFKYESSSQSFKVLPTRALTGTTDGVSIDPSKLKKILNKDTTTNNSNY